MSDDRTSFPVAFVPGVMPDKWFRAWSQRMRGTSLEPVPVEQHEQREVLDDGRARICLVRDLEDRDGLHTIALYDEVPVVVVPRDHLVTAAEEVLLADIADELLDVPATMTARERVAVVAGGAGLVVVPMSVARLHQRKDLAWRPVTDLPRNPVELAWPRDADDELTQAFVGIVRGRTARSSRGDAPETAPPKPKPPRAAAKRPAPRTRTGRRPTRRR